MAKEKKWKSAEDRFNEAFIQEVIEAVKSNSAPWQKGWASDEIHAPYNAQSSSFYSGRNAVRLAMVSMKQNYQDPRWVTAKQALDLGGHVKKGEKGTGILWYGEREVVDKETQEIKTQGVAKHYHVFNVEQTTLPVIEKEDRKERKPDVESFVAIIDAHKPKVAAGEPAYRSTNDTIYMPDKQAFKSDAEYYSTFLHEMSHWTGHEDRLNRLKVDKFGTPEYAKEELIAELSSYMLTLEHGIPFTPNQSEAYLQHWAAKADKDLETALLEGFRDATRAKNFINEPLYLKERTAEADQDKPAPAVEAKKETPEQSEAQADKSSAKVLFERIDEKAIYDELRASKPTYLAVDLTDRREAKAAGAQWDADNKCWFASDIKNQPGLQRFYPKAATTAEGKTQTDFSAEATALGLDMSNFNDTVGVWHRVPLESKEKGNKDGAYKLFDNPDGTIGGIVKNLSTGEEIKWSNRGSSKEQESKETITALRLNHALHTETMQEVRQQVEQTRSKQAVNFYLQLDHARGDEPYIAQKSMEHINGIKRLEDGSIVIPLINGERVGKMADQPVGIKSLQVIKPDGEKLLMSQATKTGSYFPIGTKEARQNPTHLYIAEGVATAEAIYQMMRPKHDERILAVAAIDSGNLGHVTEKMLAMYPGVEKTIAADQDVATCKKINRNPGLEAATAIQKKHPEIKIEAPVAIDGQNTDWSDVLLAYKNKGEETQKKAVAAIQIETQGKCPRDIGMAAYEAIKGDMNRINEVEQALKAAGFDFDRSRVADKQTPLEIKEAFGKAVIPAPDRTKQADEHTR